MSSKFQSAGKLIFLFLSVFLCSCKHAPDIEWDFSKNEITGSNQAPASEKLNVDVYLDVTTSMKGFVSPSTTNYSSLLDDIEATCSNVWKSTDIKYYKFGRSVAPISRDQFTSGKTSPVMYADPVMSTQTNFDEAVKKTDPKRVSILITDLFYKNSDVNIIVNSIKDYCFKKKVEAGVISLNSPFNGIVGDVTPFVNVKGTRPLYVLVFGDKQNIDLFFKTLKNKPYIASTQFLLIANKPTESYEAEVIKNKKCKTINKQSLPSNWKKKDYGTIFGFRMKKKETEAVFDMDIRLNTNPNIPLFRENNLKMLVFEKTEKMKDSIPVNDKVSFENIKLSSGNHLSGTIRLKNGEDAGKYSYLVYVTLDNTVPQLMPKWVIEKNTNVYAQGVNENKTLNLEKLLTDISSNHTTAVQPKLAKFYLNIEKN